jgi:hypothetical protein
VKGLVPYNAVRKEASGLRLLPWLNGVQVVGGSNPPAPTLDLHFWLQVFTVNALSIAEVTGFTGQVFCFP